MSAQKVSSAPVASKPKPSPQPQSPAITISAPSFRSAPASEEPSIVQGGSGISDDFDHFLKMHPGMSIEEALHKFREQQKAKAHVRQGPKFHR